MNSNFELHISIKQLKDLARESFFSPHLLFKKSKDMESKKIEFGEQG